MTGPLAYMLTILYTLPGAVIGLVVHELTHSAIALRAGDPTPHREKLMTLDPRRQLDPLGFLALLVTGFGWGRPVRLDPVHLRRAGPRAAVAAAGPVSHLIVAAVFAIALRIELLTSGIELNGFDTPAQRTAQGIVVGVLLQGFFINVALFIYNALPLPGLDGYAFVRALLFTRASRLFLGAESYRFYVYVVVIAIVVLLPEVTARAVNPILAATTGTAGLLIDHAVVPGAAPIFVGLPNIFELFA